MEKTNSFTELLLNYIYLFMIQFDDSVLIRYLNSQNEENVKLGLTEAFQKYKHSLISFARRHIQDESYAVDVVAYAFEQFVGRVYSGSLPQIKSLGGYLHNMVRNTARNYNKKSERFPEFISYNDESHLDDEQASEEDWIDNHSIEHILLCLFELEAQRRTALTMKFFMKYRATEIAIFIDEKPTTVRTWITRGRDALKKCLDGKRKNYSQKVG